MSFSLLFNTNGRQHDVFTRLKKISAEILLLFVNNTERMSGIRTMIDINVPAFNKNKFVEMYKPSDIDQQIP